MRGHWKARRLVVKVVIIGLGYVGLPLAQEAVRVGLRVTGLDVRQAAVDSLNAGRSHVDDLTDADVAAMVAGGFRAVATVPDVAAIVDEQGSDELGSGELGSGELGTGEHGPDVIVICVPTPLSESDGPDLTAVKAATDSAAKLLRAGTTVVLESTTYPGTTDEIVRPMLEKATGLTAGIDFSLAFSPERIDPGNGVYGIRNTPKVVGGITPACTDAAAAFYARVCDTVVRAKTAREAEMAKLLENTYRHVNIALVNEMAIFCHELGVDLWDAIRCASTKPFGFEAFYPGPGVGGHCIPIDPNYLSYKVRMELSYPFRFVELAQEINSRMPGYVVDRAAEILNSDAKPIKGARVLLLGVTYKKDIADQRESPARPIARKLLQRGAVLSYHDPYVESWTVDGRQVPRAQAPTDDADLTILLQAHSVYDLQEVAARAHLLFDTRGQRLPGDSVFPL
jgi:nucleotide sugar dehydrogenase